MRRYGIWKFLLWLMVFIILTRAVVELIPETHVIGRVKYEWQGAGEEQWEQEAAAAGIPVLAEEYYYTHLPQEFHEAYREIFVRLMRGEDEGPLYSRIGVDDFWTVYYAVLADHPEIFWVGASAQISESGLTGTVISYKVDTVVPKEERDAMLLTLQASADECIWQIPADTSEYEKIKFVYEFIIDTTEYDGDAADSQNIQSVLIYQRSVCAGYSKAFQYILNRMGLFCTYITGTIQNGGDHGWNMVRIGENYYYVDVTWGDPVFVNEVSDTENRTMNYNYLCCTETDLFQTHTPKISVPLPACTSDDYNYYRLNDMYYEVFDYDTIYSRLMNSVWNGDSSIDMKFGSSEAYEQAKYELLEGNLLKDPGQYLMEINGVQAWNYRYHADDKFNLITIYW